VAGSRSFKLLKLFGEIDPQRRISSDACGLANQKQISDAAFPATSRESIENPNPQLEKMGGRNIEGESPT